MRQIILLLAMCGVSLSVAAPVTGRVIDSRGNPVEGANIYLTKASRGAVTTADGSFGISEVAVPDTLIVSFVGYCNDTVPLVSDATNIDIVLQESTALDEVVITERRQGLIKSRVSPLNEDMITSAELLRAACCNLGESFTTNPSVDVSYSDAATGARQIKLLGLSGTYVQMLTENIPNYRGAAAPYSLGYIPGTWMQSIQVSKGASSVKNGYESITGQINVEFKKPQATESFSANLFANSLAKLEANFDANTHLTPRLSTSLLAHYENNLMAHDSNHDGFMDMPRVEQYNVQNRWAYMGDNYVFQAAVKALRENRRGGQMTAVAGEPLYSIGINTDRYELFTKNAYIFDKEKSTNMALILAGSLHRQDAAFGYKDYRVDQWTGYASLMFETQFDKHNSISAGLSLNHDSYDERYRLSPLPHAEAGTDTETVPGAYVQYTYNLADKFLLMAGVRADYSNRYGFFVTPRLHLKYTPHEVISLRASVGKGYRPVHALAENNYLLASSRRLVIDTALDQEEAWNTGISAALYIPLWGKTMNLNVEYYYTYFLQQAVIDMDTDPHAVMIYNLDGKSYSHTFQAEVSYPVFKGFTCMLAYRYTDVRTTYGGVLKERPFIGRYKGLLTASYQTAMGIWQFDATLQLNGGGRLPDPYTTADGSLSWDYRYKTYEQLNVQVTRNFRNWAVYVGGENLTGFRQPHPIIDAAHPWGDCFDSTISWGPMHGAVFYVGVRYNWEKL